MKKYAVLLLTFSLIAPTFTGAAPGYGRDRLKGTTKTQGDFNLGQRYNVYINGKLVPGVRAIQGLGIAINSIGHTRPGNHKPGKVRISLGITKSYSPADLAWSKAGPAERKSVSVIFRSGAGSETMRINFYNCWPTSWHGPSLNARNSAHATETIDLSCSSGRVGA